MIVFEVKADPTGNPTDSCRWNVQPRLSKHQTSQANDSTYVESLACEVCLMCTRSNDSHTYLCYTVDSLLNHTTYVLPWRRNTQSHRWRVWVSTLPFYWVTTGIYDLAGILNHRWLVTTGIHYLAGGLASEAVDWVWCVLAARWTILDSTPNKKHIWRK